MATTWRVMIGQQQEGPYDEKAVADLIAKGRIRGETFAWREGMANWQAIQTIPELSGLLAAPAVPPPPPPPSPPLAQGIITWQGPSELEGPKVTGITKGLRAASGRLMVKDHSLIVKGLLMSQDIGIVTSLYHVVFINKNKTKARFHLQGVSFWTFTAPKREELAKFVEELGRGLPNLKITHEEIPTFTPKTVVGLVLVAVFLAMVIAAVSSKKDSPQPPAIQEPQDPISMARGPKPREGWSASAACIEDYLKKEYLKDPDSYQSIEWSPVSPTGEYWGVRHKYRAKNSFGGYVVENKLFLFQTSKGYPECKVHSVTDF